MPVENVINIKLGRKATLSTDSESELVNFILEMEKFGIGLTKQDIKSLAYQLAIRNNLKHILLFSQEKKLTGKTWLHSFLNRHPVLSFPTNTSIARMKGFNRQNVNEFYDLLEKNMEKFKYLANNVYNVDETIISVVPSKMPEILSLKDK